MAELPVDRRKAFAFRVVAVGLSVTLTLLVVEAGIRVGYLFRHARRPNQMVVDEAWGWRATPDLDTSYEKFRFGTIDYRTDSRGSRRFGDLGTDKLRVMVIGDSFTQAAQISNGKTYYDRLQELRTDVEVFAYGVGGFGTLQELLALERFDPEVGPDLVLWQFCENDFINNDHDLESRSVHDNNHMFRPYLEQGEIVVRSPDGLLGSLARISYLARRVAVLRGSLRLRIGGDITERLSADQPDFRRSRRTTDQLMERVAAAAGDATVVAFYVAALQPRDYRSEAFDAICRDRGIRCVPDLRPAFFAAREAGVAVDGYPDDDHWSAAGHALAAEQILEFLIADGILPAAPTP